jgi:hypothetical protein
VWHEAWTARRALAGAMFGRSIGWPGAALPCALLEACATPRRFGGPPTSRGIRPRRHDRNIAFRDRKPCSVPTLTGSRPRGDRPRLPGRARRLRHGARLHSSAGGQSTVSGWAGAERPNVTAQFARLQEIDQHKSKREGVDGEAHFTSSGP